MFEAMLKPVVAGLAGALLSYLFSLLRHVAPRKLAWRVTHPNQTYFSIATSVERKFDANSVQSQNADPTELRFALYGTYIGQVRALGILLPDFCQAYKMFDPSKVFLSEQLPPELYDCDIVSIGGPIPNRTTRFFLDRISSELPIMIENHELTFRQDAKELVFRPTYDGDAVKRDIGVVIKFPNPENTTRECLLFFGMRTFGSEAAAKAFTTILVGVKHLMAKRYIAIVEAGVDGSAVRQPTLLLFHRF
jgi:hypothetical protein